MARGATLTYPWELALLVQRGLTVAISGHNAFYLARYRSRRGRRRLGAAILMLINLAIGGESVAFGLLPWALGEGKFTEGSRLVAASLSLAVVVAIAVLILRQKTRRR